MGKGKSHWEWDMSRQGLSWKAKLKYAIDQVVKESENFDDFLAKCADFGILYEYNPNRGKSGKEYHGAPSEAVGNEYRV
ncbi:hypothetical protein [Ruminococcus sp.]|uniref:hypothetical protein n=1 Tax=Ruminococcus sp. TaxID=41978 RepID=UPI0025DF6DFC|nr:hypothetical protein [Ruminococcus sp.]